MLINADRGQIKVADFGLARAITAQTATATSMLIGTVSYIAPELAVTTHGKADPRCDVYALGVVLYEMLTGTKPTPATTRFRSPTRTCTRPFQRRRRRSRRRVHKGVANSGADKFKPFFLQCLRHGV